MSDVPVALIGMGKMGRALAALAPERGFRVVAELDRGAIRTTPAITRDRSPARRWPSSSPTPDAAAANMRACAAAGCPVVVGTTGWYDAAAGGRRRDVERAGGAMLTAPNFSVGVAVFDRVVAEAARLFAQLDGLRRAPRRDASRGEEGRAVRHGGRARAHRGGGARPRDPDHEHAHGLRARHARGRSSTRPSSRCVSSTRRATAASSPRARSSPRAGWSVGAAYSRCATCSRQSERGDMHERADRSRAAAPRSPRRSRRPARSTSARCAASSTGRSTRGSTSSCRAAPPVRRRRCRSPSSGASSRSSSSRRGPRARRRRRGIERHAEGDRAVARACSEAGATHLLHVVADVQQAAAARHRRALPRDRRRGRPADRRCTTCPSRTGSNIEATTTLELAAIRGIVAHEGGVGQPPQITDILVGRPERLRRALRRRRAHAADHARSAAMGSISVRLERRAAADGASSCDAARAGDFERARASCTSGCCRGCAPRSSSRIRSP